MKTIIAVLLSLLIAGCATTHDPDQYVLDWVKANRPLAVQGTMKWSDYYTQYYQQAIMMQSPLKPTLLDTTNKLISQSKDYESGKISKDQFESYQRDAQVANMRAAQEIGFRLQQQRALDQASSAATMGAAATLMQAGQQPRLQTQCRTTTFGGVAQTTCQ